MAKTYVSRAPEWSENAVHHEAVKTYVFGLEVWPDQRRARLYTAEGSTPCLTGPNVNSERVDTGRDLHRGYRG